VEDVRRIGFDGSATSGARAGATDDHGARIVLEAATKALSQVRQVRHLTVQAG
jgi:hypothetical protein